MAGGTTSEISRVYIDFNDFREFTKRWIDAVIPKLKSDCNFVSFFPKEHSSWLYWELVNRGFHGRNILVWVKTNPVPHLRKVQFASGTEFIVWCSRGKNTFNYKIGHSTNWYMSPIVMPNERIGHPTEKSMGLMMWLVDYLTVRGQTVLDPFMGSGTTGGV